MRFFKLQALLVIGTIIASLVAVAYSLYIQRAITGDLRLSLSYWPWHWMILFAWCTWSLCLTATHKEDGWGYQLMLAWPWCAALMIAVPVAHYLLFVVLHATLDVYEFSGMLLIFVPATLPDSGRAWLYRKLAFWNKAKKPELA